MGSWEKVLAEHLVRLLATPLHSFGQPFIVSFCEDGDLLSQWRAYGGTSGFSLAFSRLCQHDNVKLVCKDGFRTMVKRVIYDPERQRARLHFLLTHLMDVEDLSAPLATEPKMKARSIRFINRRSGWPKNKRSTACLVPVHKALRHLRSERV
jgi:hypothetical protein